MSISLPNEELSYLIEPPADPEQVMPDVGDVSFSFGHPDVDALCGYMDWNNGTFELYERQYFAGLSALLQLNGTIAAGVTVGRDTFRSAVRAFQKSHGLGADGIPGADTLWAMHAPRLAQAPIGTTKVAAEKVSGSGGFDSFTVRSDIADAYNKLHAEVVAARGCVTSAGALRPLNADVSAGRSATSLHYSGLALDLATDTGMSWSARNAWKYLISLDGDKWRVYVDAPSQPKRPVNAVIWENGKTRTQVIEGTYLDFTATAQKYGFEPIRPRSSFPGSYISGEWWHFQYVGGLVPGISLFGVELRKLYTEKQLENTPPWQWRKNIYCRWTSQKGWC